MNKYKSYMDRVAVSDELHEKLLHLEKAPRKPIRWQKYAAVACAVLLLGAGVWAAGGRPEEERWRDLVLTFEPSAITTIESAQPSAPGPVPCAAPSPPTETIDLAPEDPNGAEPGMKTIEGYEVKINRAGMDLVEYHILPWIDYGTENNAAAVALDWDIPAGAIRRDLSQQEIIALLGGADAVVHHLDWSTYELSGWGAWCVDGDENGDGPFWGAYLMGYKGPMDHFEFAVTAGQLPPTCIAFDGSVEQEIWGLTVTADKYDGKDGCERRVSFMKDDYGYRFDLTATGGAEEAEKLVSRAVTWIANGDGLDLSIALFHGADFPSREPGSPAEEPSWDDEVESPPSPPSQDGASSQDWAAAPSVPPAPADGGGDS